MTDGRRISLIVAMAANRVIGRDNTLPWRLPDDLRRFKRLTMGHTLVMGRKTWESIGRPLPGRDIVVVTRQERYATPAGVSVARSVEEALEIAKGDEVFVAGGEEVFRQTIDRADRLYLTRIDTDFPGDTFFPEFDPERFRLVEREDHEATEEIPFGYSFLTYDRDGESC
jgi:dihydrofolate reductase